MLKRNWLHETRNQEINRRLNAVETHIQDLESRYSHLENQYLLLANQIREDEASLLELGGIVEDAYRNTARPDNTK